MAELTNVAFFKAKHGRSKALGTALLALVSPTQREAGNLRYVIYQSKDAPDEWIVVEDWRHHSDFDEHMKTTYVREFLTKAADLCVNEIEIQKFQRRFPANG